MTENGKKEGEKRNWLKGFQASYNRVTYSRSWPTEA